MSLSNSYRAKLRAHELLNKKPLTQDQKNLLDLKDNYIIKILELNKATKRAEEYYADYVLAKYEAEPEYLKNARIEKLAAFQAYNEECEKQGVQMSVADDVEELEPRRDVPDFMSDRQGRLEFEKQIKDSLKLRVEEYGQEIYYVIRLSRMVLARIKELENGTPVLQ